MAKDIFESRLPLFCNTHAGGQRLRSVRQGPQRRPQAPNAPITSLSFSVCGVLWC